MYQLKAISTSRYVSFFLGVPNDSAGTWTRPSSPESIVLTTWSLRDQLVIGLHIKINGNYKMSHELYSKIIFCLYT